MTRVLVVDDERNIQKAYASDISSAGDRYSLVDCISNAADCMMLCSSGAVDLVLMDINTAKNESGIDATARLKKAYPNIKVIITTSYTDPDALARAREAGADSFWFKDYSDIELLEVMDRTVEGSGYWPGASPDVAIGDSRISQLTETEINVIHALVECVSIKKMAEKLFVEESTIKTHLKNIYNKVGCSNKTELLIMVMQAKLVLPKKNE